MVTYSFYERDNRVRRYAETLLKRGDAVDVISLRQGNQADYDEINGVRVYRIQSREFNENGKLSYLWRVSKFLTKSGFFLSRQHLREPYDLIHVHSVPDYEVFSALIPKLKGAKVILDIHDLVPEFYCSKFGKEQGSLIYKTLILIEKCSAAFSDHVIASNHIWYQRLVDRSVSKKKCTVILNYPDSSLFRNRENQRNDGKLIILYPGTLNWHQGLDIAIRAFNIIKEKVPKAEFHIYGEGPSKQALTALVSRLGLERRVLLQGARPINRIAEIMSCADIGIVPKTNDPFGGEAFSTKILEFMLLGIPLIVAKTKIDEYYFNSSVVQYFEPGDENDLAKNMLLMLTDKEKRASLSQKAREFVAQYTWERNKREYLDLVDSLAFSTKG